MLKYIWDFRMQPMISDELRNSTVLGKKSQRCERIKRYVDILQGNLNQHPKTKYSFI